MALETLKNEPMEYGKSIHMLICIDNDKLMVDIVRHDLVQIYQIS